MNTKTKLLPLVTPGEMLVEEFLKPLGITEYRLAKDIGVPPRRINEIVHGKRAITADTAFRLSQYFGNSSQFWLNLQADYDGRYFWQNASIPATAYPACVSKFELLSDSRVRNDCHSRHQRGDGKEAEQEASHAAIGFFHFNPRKRAKSVSVECSTQLCSTASAARRASETRFAVALPTRSIF
jgi:addiction module HigA family antidote